MKKIVYFFYPHLANGFPDVPAVRDGTRTNYKYKLTKKIETNVNNKRVKKKANEQSYSVPRTNLKK